jgi:hypothetical protein
MHSHPKVADIPALAAKLSDAGVEFIIVGGAAAARYLTVHTVGGTWNFVGPDSISEVGKAGKNGCSGDARANSPSRTRTLVPGSLRSAWASRLPSFLGAVRFGAARLGASRP